MARTSSFGASGRISQSDFNKKATELSEKLGAVPKPEPKARQNRTNHRGRPSGPRGPEAREDEHEAEAPQANAAETDETETETKAAGSDE
jgi:hypothetical protein